MKAWLVYHKDDIGGGEIVHAETRGKAIAGSDAYFDSQEWNSIIAKRAPGFDDKPLNDKTYIENGWFVYCNGPRCEHTIEDYNFEYEEDGYRACWDGSGEYAYCSEKCKQEAELKDDAVSVCEMTPELWDVLNPIGQEIENAESHFRFLSRHYGDLFDFGHVVECQRLFAEVNNTFGRLWIAAGGVL